MTAVRSAGRWQSSDRSVHPVSAKRNPVPNALGAISRSPTRLYTTFRTNPARNHLPTKLLAVGGVSSCGHENNHRCIGSCLRLIPLRLPRTHQNPPIRRASRELGWHKRNQGGNEVDFSMSSKGIDLPLRTETGGDKILLQVGHHQQTQSSCNSASGVTYQFDARQCCVCVGRDSLTIVVAALGLSHGYINKNGQELIFQQAKSP